MRKFRDQVIATTAQPQVGSPITKEQLQAIFNQLPDPNVKYQKHDRSLPPIGRTMNKRFHELSPGIWGIVVDIEVSDGVDVSELKGSSISFTDKGFTPEKDRVPDVVIQLDAQHFTDDDLRSVVGSTSDGVMVGAERRRQFGLVETVTIAAVTFAALKFAEGFFKEPGSDLYKYLKARLLGLAATAESKGSEVSFDFGFTVSDEAYDYVVKLRADKSVFHLIESGLVTMAMLQDEMRSIHDPSKVETVYVRLVNSPPYLRTVRIEPRD